MTWRRWLRPEPEPREGGLIGYRRELLLFLSAFTFFAAWLSLLNVVVRQSPTIPQTLTVWFGLGLAVATLLLRRSWPRLASWLFVVGSLLWIGLLHSMLQPPGILSFLALPVLLAGLLVGSPLALATSACALVMVVSLGSGPAATSSFWLVLITASLGVSIITDRGLQLIDIWERETTRQQRQLILQLRERQGELNRALKALDEAYESLRRSHDELFQARQQADEARALKEQFVANVSHELRTPLNLVVGFADIMYLVPETYDGVTWTPDLENDIREMYRAARHLQSLVDDVLDLSRIDAARLPLLRELSDVRTVIAEAVETIAPLTRQRGLSLAVKDLETLPQVFIDRTRIRQVLLNLLNNAVRFTDAGGITVGAGQEGGVVIVSVSDTGVGISADQLEHIFEEFRQVDAGPRSRGGTGLGLALSRQFVELHGGRMWAESEVGVGTTLRFSLPLPGVKSETGPLYHIPYRKQPERADAPVVVVDPDSTVADMLRRYLGDRKLLAARDAREADRLIESEHPLAVILNQMPDAPSGTWLGPLSETATRYSVPILRCAIPSASWLQQATGLDGCLTKPISRETLGCLLQGYPEPPRSILVVDDDAGFVSLICRMLATLGTTAKVTKAYSGAQALRLAREKPPDLVLLDLLMPEMDGFELLRAIRGDPALRHTRVTAITATSYGEEVLHHRGAQFTLTQSPGISTSTLTELLQAVLGIVRPRYVPGQ